MNEMSQQVPLKSFCGALTGKIPHPVFDGDSLCIKVRPNRRKWWRFKYRYEAKEKLLSTVEAVALAGLAHRSRGWTAGPQEAITAPLANPVFPVLGTRAVRDIACRDIKQVVQAIDKQGARETAGRVFQRLRSIYRYALSEDWVEVDPTYALKPSEVRPQRLGKFADASYLISTFGSALRSSET